MIRHRFAFTHALPTVLFAMSLAGCGGGSSDPPSAAAPEPASTEVTAALLERGAGVYKANCIPCHGPLGKGDGPSSAMLDPKPRDHSNRTYMDQLTDQQIANTIVQGGAPKYPNMPSHPHLRGEDLVAIVAHVRTLGRGRDEVTTVELAAK